MAKMIHLVMSGWFLAVNVYAKATKSIAKLMNSIANGTNSTAKAMNSTANRMKSIAKVTNSTCNAHTFLIWYMVVAYSLLSYITLFKIDE